MITVDGATETRYYYHFDGLGSVIALSNVNNQIVEQYSYDVFGRPSTASSVGNPYLFTGREYDSETGLYYYRARYYVPEIGRFLQTDPVGYGDGMNIYAYVKNNAINLVDPFGLYDYTTAETREIMNRAKTNLIPPSSTIPYYRGGFDYKPVLYPQKFEVPFAWGNKTLVNTEYSNMIAGYKNTYQHGLQGAAGAYATGLFYAAIENNGRFWVEWQDDSAWNITEGALQGFYERATEWPWERAKNILEGLWNYPRDAMAVLEAWTDAFGIRHLPLPNDNDIPYGIEGCKKK